MENLMGWSGLPGFADCGFARRCNRHLRTTAILGCAIFAALPPYNKSAGGVYAQHKADPQSAASVTEGAVAGAAAAERRLREHLSTAHRILTIEIAPALSRELCEDRSRRDELGRIARMAEQHLVEARQELAKLADSDSRDALEAEVDQLASFAALFASLGSLTDDPATQSRVVAACGELAAWFDFDDKSIVESAKLWQGAAYRRVGRSDRALQVLRPVLAEPASPVIGYWARLERARALGDEKRFAAGIALCLRLETLASTWFKDESEEQVAARRTARQVRAALLNQWAKQLKKQGRDRAAAAAETKARELAEELVRVPEPTRFLKLVTAIDSTQEGEAGKSKEPAEDSPAPSDDDAAGDPEDSEPFDDSEENPQEDDTGT